MASFAERMGVKPIRSIIQVEDLDAETRTALWNYEYKLQQMFMGEARFYNLGALNKVEESVWRYHYHQALDHMTHSAVWSRLRTSVMDGDVIDSLGSVEGFVDACDLEEHPDLAKAIAKEFNRLFSRFLVGFRFVELELVPVSSDAEVETVAQAIELTAAYSGAQQHLRNAVQLLSDRVAPNYPKVVAEAIHSVEAIVRHLTGSKTLGEGLKQLESRGFAIHPALRDGWLKIYGYTSDGSGIRHGSISDSEVDEKLASYFLVSCSAFVNLLIKVESQAKQS